MKKSTANKLFLLSIREIYLSSKNVLGLLIHPYQTIREIRLKKDLSQFAILFVSPSLFLIFFSLFFWWFRGVLHAPFFKMVAGGLLYLFLSADIVFFGYLGYWVAYYILIGRRARNA